MLRNTQTHTSGKWQRRLDAAKAAFKTHCGGIRLQGKKTVSYQEQDQQQVAAYQEEIKDIPVEKIAYVDESGIDTYNCLEHFVSAGDGSMLPLMIAAMEDENDREFMEWLYLQYPRLIYSEVRKLVQNGDEAEDLMQTVVEKLIHKVDLLRDLERRRLVNYVISTAKNTAQNFLRDKHPAAGAWEEQEQLADPAPMPEEEILYREDLSSLSKVWSTLDEKTQYLLSARYILNKSGREIAADLQMPLDNVRMALVRARRKAQQAMARAGARQ